MPVSVKNVDGYRVSTPGGVKAKHTSLRNALRQKRLLNAVEHGFQPTGAKPTRSVEGELRKRLRNR